MSLCLSDYVVLSAVLTNKCTTLMIIKRIWEGDYFAKLRQAILISMQFPLFVYIETAAIGDKMSDNVQQQAVPQSERNFFSTPDQAEVTALNIWIKLIKRESSVHTRPSLSEKMEC